MFSRWGRHLTFAVSIICSHSEQETTVQQCDINMLFLVFVEKRLGCAFKDHSFFILQCSNPLKIHIVNSTLGRSAAECVGNERCCPSNYICTVEATSEHLQKLIVPCDGKQECRIAVLREWCQVGSKTSLVDFESVTYTCGTPQGEVTTQSTWLLWV